MPFFKERKKRFNEKLKIFKSCYDVDETETMRDCHCFTTHSLLNQDVQVNIENEKSTFL